MIEFHKAKIENGEIKTIDVKIIDQSTICKCPHLILDPSHYNDNGTCKCNDPHSIIMKSWGYKWNKKLGRWTSSSLRSYKKGKELWELLGDMPIDDNENIDQDFNDLDGSLLFPKGTNKFEIWHWFENNFENFECRYEVT